MKFQQRDIVEVSFELRDGSLKIHPALVISNDEVFDVEDIFYAVMISTKPFNDEFTYELSNDMLSKPLAKKSFVKCQLIQSYQANEIVSKISSMKQSYFQEVKKKILKVCFKATF